MGDKNTSSFHKFASPRRHMNRIHGLQRYDGSVATNSIEIGNIARDYFVNLFESSGTGNMDHILSGVPCCISESMNQCLLVIYSKEEVIEALNGIGPTKASGPDGFPTIFFQKYWNIIGKDTCNFCLGILNDGKSLEEINKTKLVLILKIVNPSNLKNFLLISLIIYKIIAKTIAKRLQKVLYGCIDGSQSAFVLDRLITDNVLLAYEILHYFKNKRSGRNGFMALKLVQSSTQFCLMEKEYQNLTNHEGYVKEIL
ncbi:hypothetical protein PVK06_040243 [Gossypium arboreum]|uniref:Reverse transcriptase n=1 Tax=Gossypium arboreum TaxID=29729 RepID=A0ABR0N4X9_GOSAR|nr:hypothetical protein PVK06_040243 [Gossypium arboreum]